MADETERLEQAAEALEKTGDEGVADDGSELNGDPNLLQSLWQRSTQTGGKALRGGKELISRLKCSFTVSGADCAPDFFVNEEGEYFDFTITLRALTAGEEASAMRGGDVGEVQGALVKASLFALNGTPFQEDQKDLIWEALGMKGRQIVNLAYQQIGGASAAALGKYRKSFTVF